MAVSGLALPTRTSQPRSHRLFDERRQGICHCIEHVLICQMLEHARPDRPILNELLAPSHSLDVRDDLRRLAAGVEANLQEVIRLSLQHEPPRPACAPRENISLP